MDLTRNEQVAEELYETYSEAVGGVAFNGDPLPKWSVFSIDPDKTKQANAWREVTSRAVVCIKDQLT